VVPPRLVMANDHRGSRLKRELRERLEQEGHEIVDLGTNGEESVDYPEFAAPAARAVSEGKYARGILICGSGLGVMYAANRFPGVRAALAHDVEAAEMSRLHNDANMLALSGDRLDAESAWPIVRAWLETPFEGGRHERWSRCRWGAAPLLPRWTPRLRRCCAGRRAGRR